MADGSYKPIEQVKIGDLVLSMDESSGKIEGKQVVQTSVRQHIATLILKFEDGSSVETTNEHPLYAEGKGFTKAGEVGIGTAIVTRAGPALRITGVEPNAHATTVYNFTVADFHTYFVGQAGLWVHNITCPDPEALAEQLVNRGHAWGEGTTAYGYRARLWAKNLGITTKEQLIAHLANVIRNPTASKNIENDTKIIYLHDPSETIVIYDPQATYDGGTAFQPNKGQVGSARKYYDSKN